uniref:Zinc finger protein 384 like n=1 Tax=Oryzias latipes TaxID=8090 RepID=A0A3P9KNI2_ORYLA
MDDSHFNSSYFWSPVPTVQGQIENAMFLNKAKEQLGPEKANAPPFPHSSASSTSSPHFPTAVLAIPSSVDPGSGVRVVPKQEGGGSGAGVGGNSSGASLSAVGGHLHQSHTSQNVTVVPVPSTGIMTAAGLVITTPQGTLVPTASTQSFVTGPPSATTMIVSALHPSNTDKKDDVAVPPAVVMPTPSKRGRKSKQGMGRVGGVLPPGSDALILGSILIANNQYFILKNCFYCQRRPQVLQSDMQIHAKSHTEAKPHKCPHCSKSFANSSYLSQHIRIHSGAKPYTCTYCQKTFRQLSHLQQHTRYPAGGFLTSSVLKISRCFSLFLSLHPLPLPASRVRNHTEAKPHKCPHCSKSFTALCRLSPQSHRRQHNKDKPYKCHNCNRGYTDAASLEVHLSTHTVKHAKLFSCGLCNRSYTSETYLMKHMRKHNPDPLTVAATVAAQQAQGLSTGGGGRGRGRGRGRGGVSGGGGRGASQLQSQSNPNNTNQNPNPGPPGSYQSTQQPSEAVVQCPFDLHQYKTVAANEIQYKPVTVADLPVTHKDLCLTVSTSAIQVEHMNS